MPETIAIFSDPHIHPFARFSSVGLSGVNSWVEETLSVMEEMYEDCRKRGVNNIYCAGDLFHTGNKIQTDVFNSVVRFFRKYKNCIHTTIIAGNHDYAKLSGGECALLALEPDVHVVLEGVEHQLFGKNDMYLVPWTTNYAQLVTDLSAAIQKAPPAPAWSKPFLIGHLALSGATVGRLEYTPEAGCPASVLKMVEFAYLGHYHQRQQVGHKAKYIGSLVSRRFDDADTTKGYTLLEIAGNDFREWHVPVKSTLFRVIDATDTHVLEVSGSGFMEAHVRGNAVRIDYDRPLQLMGQVVGEDAFRDFYLKTGRAKHVVFNRLSSPQTQTRVPMNEDGGEPSVKAYLQAYLEDIYPETGQVELRNELFHVGCGIVDRVHEERAVS